MHLPRWAWWAPLFHITVFIAYVIIAIYFDPREHPSDTEQVSLLPVGDQPQHLYSEKSNIPSTPSTPSSRQLTPRPSYSSLTDAMRNEQKSRSSSPRHLSIPKRCSLLLESRAGRRLLSKILYESRLVVIPIWLAVRFSSNQWWLLVASSLGFYFICSSFQYWPRALPWNVSQFSSWIIKHSYWRRKSWKGKTKICSNNQYFIFNSYATSLILMQPTDFVVLFFL